MASDPAFPVNETVLANVTTSSQHGFCGEEWAYYAKIASCGWLFLSFALAVLFGVQDKIKTHWVIKSRLLFVATVGAIFDGIVKGLALPCPGNGGIFAATVAEYVGNCLQKLAALALAIWALWKEIAGMSRPLLPLTNPFQGTTTASANTPALPPTQSVQATQLQLPPPQQQVAATATATGAQPGTHNTQLRGREVRTA
ncbi:hypothetical protein DOTSEDRAFT_29660 [Dothistroma septosporum NZE10]|uniref:Uncharacterized protein n=1 Tax=Dothistroma septosporum (strain NZE10 / CBS 128990) TaxID=675120 RepID=M2YHT4_DOTSN|nr:hypothetical protein DOTSEDRAFT_29660 [Dothistroma septosporum NZE10]